MHPNITTRLINSVVEALNDADRLPHFLIIAVDKDILNDFQEFEYGIASNLSAVINWITRQIEILVCRKKSQIAEKKPGAIGAESDPTVIFIDMIQCPQMRSEGEAMARLRKILDLCYKFNSILHEAIVNQNQ